MRGHAVNMPILWVWLISAVATTVIVAPLSRGGYLLYGDAVSTPRSYVTDFALGIGDLPARAVPQDWFVALTSHLIDGGVVVAILIYAAMLFAGVGAGCLTHKLLPATRSPGSAVAAAFAIWNPYVAERLNQGQWSLLIGYACIPWLIYLGVSVFRNPHVQWWRARLVGLCAIAAITPTGGVFAMMTVAAVWIWPLARAHRRWSALIAGVTALAANAPWIIVSAISDVQTSDAAGATTFAARAEPGLGTVGSLAGLGGIWNADAVPASRSIGWAAVATVALLVVVVSGLPALARRRRRLPLLYPLTLLGSCAIVLPAISATAPGLAVLHWCVSTIPGAGLLRDTSKFVGLAMPLYALASAASVQWIGRVIPRGVVGAVAITAIVAPLPDLAGSLSPIRYPGDLTAVAATINAAPGDVAVAPSSSNRRYSFADNAISLDPLPRMVKANVVASGELIVDGKLIDPAAPTSRAHRVAAAVMSRDPVPALRDQGITWLVTENRQAESPSPLSPTENPIVAGEYFSLYAVSKATTAHASLTLRRGISWGTHVVWLAMLVAGAIGLAGYVRTRRVR